MGDSSITIREWLESARKGWGDKYSHAFRAAGVDFLCDLTDGRVFHEEFLCSELLPRIQEIEPRPLPLRQLRYYMHSAGANIEPPPPPPTLVPLSPRSLPRYVLQDQWPAVPTDLSTHSQSDMERTGPQVKAYTPDASEARAVDNRAVGDQPSNFAYAAEKHAVVTPSEMDIPLATPAVSVQTTHSPSVPSVSVSATTSPSERLHAVRRTLKRCNSNQLSRAYVPLDAGSRALVALAHAAHAQAQARARAQAEAQAHAVSQAAALASTTPLVVPRNVSWTITPVMDHIPAVPGTPLDDEEEVVEVESDMTTAGTTTLWARRATVGTAPALRASQAIEGVATGSVTISDVATASAIAVTERARLRFSNATLATVPTPAPIPLPVVNGVMGLSMVAGPHMAVTDNALTSNAMVASQSRVLSDHAAAVRGVVSVSSVHSSGVTSGATSQTFHGGASSSARGGIPPAKRLCSTPGCTLPVYHTGNHLSELARTMVQAATMNDGETLCCAICHEELDFKLVCPCERDVDGGWGFTQCCANSYHFECLAQWLKSCPGSETEYVRNCPTCRNRLSRSRRRMLVPTCPSHVHIPNAAENVPESVPQARPPIQATGCQLGWMPMGQPLGEAAAAAVAAAQVVLALSRKKRRLADS